MLSIQMHYYCEKIIYLVLRDGLMKTEAFISREIATVQRIKMQLRV